MKNKDILLLDQVLPELSPPDMDRWFNYAVQETIQRAAAKAKSIREVIAPKEKMKEYQDKLKELQKKHATQDEYGEPVKEVKELGGGRVLEKFIIPEVDNPRGKFRKAVDKLDREYKETIDEYNKGLEFLDEENKDFEPYWVTVDQHPNGLTIEEGKAVFLMTKKPAAK